VSQRRHTKAEALLAWVCAILICCAPLRMAHADARGERTARAHFKRAERAFNLGKFNEARKGYEAAFEAQPLPAFVFNIAQCHRNLGNAERALFFYRRYLSLDPNGANRALVQDLIAEQERHLAELEAAAGPAPEPDSEPNPAVEPAPPGEVTAESRSPIPDLRPRPPQGEAPTRSLVATPLPPAPATPLYQRWWVWVAGGVLVTGLAAALLIEREGPLPTGQLGGADLR
jgi:hypothetical protein